MKLKRLGVKLTTHLHLVLGLRRSGAVPPLNHMPSTVIFRRVRKFAKNDYELCHVCPSVRVEQLGSHWKDFHEVLYFSIFRKLVQKIKVSSKSDKNSGYFTRRPIYSFDHITLSSS
jgi:hypothetical protein